MFINMRFVVLILPVLVRDVILTVGILRKIKKIVVSFCVMTSLGPGYLFGVLVIHRVVLALFVIVFGTSDPDVRSLWSSCLGFWCGYM